jgi:small subunit ribosomal protein S17
MNTVKQVQSVTGIVVKRCSAQTIRVSTKVTKVHPLYKKRYTRTRYYLVHDPAETVEIGTEVTIVTCRPISKTKHWVIK